MKKTLVLVTLCSALGSVQAQTKWDLPSIYAANTFQVENLQWFATEVDKATKGKLRITLHPSGTLFKAAEIKKAVQGGQAPVGEFILSSASSENALFGVDSIPFLATSYAEARKLNDISNPHLEKLLATQGMTLLYTVPWPGQLLYSKKPVGSMTDLKGSKMRAYNPATSRIAEYVGAQPVTVQLPELPQMLDSGSVDNFLTSSASGVESRLYEHVRYVYDVNAWLPRNGVVVNNTALAALDSPTRAAVLRVAKAAGERGWKTSAVKNEAFLKELSANGMTVDKDGVGLKRELKVIGGRMTSEWVRQAGAEGQDIIDAYRKDTGGVASAMH